MSASILDQLARGRTPGSIATMFRRIVRSVLVALAFAGGHAIAAPVYDTAVSNADMVGSRSTAPNGGLGFAAYAGTGFSATFSWSITSITGGYHYRYEFDTPTGNGPNWDALSHFVLDLSDNCTLTSSCFRNLSLTYGAAAPVGEIGTFGTYTSANGNPQIPGTIVGVKFANGVLPVVFEFDSDRIPVWGDFYAKQGNPDGTARNPNGYAVWNLGLVPADHGSSDKQLFIARPDTAVVGCPNGDCANVPVPGTVALLGLGMLALSAGRRYSRRSPI